MNVFTYSLSNVSPSPWRYFILHNFSLWASAPSLFAVSTWNFILSCPDSSRCILLADCATKIQIIKGWWKGKNALIRSGWSLINAVKMHGDSALVIFNLTNRAYSWRGRNLSRDVMRRMQPSMKQKRAERKDKWRETGGQRHVKHSMMFFLAHSELLLLIFYTRFTQNMFTA